MREVPLVTFSDGSFISTLPESGSQTFLSFPGKEWYSLSVLCTFLHPTSAILSWSQTVAFAACTGPFAGWAWWIWLANFADASKREVSRHLCPECWLLQILALLSVILLLFSERPELILPPTCGCNAIAKKVLPAPQSHSASGPGSVPPVAVCLHSRTPPFSCACSFPALGSTTVLE